MKKIFQEKSISDKLREAQEKNPKLKNLPIKSYTINMSEIREIVEKLEEKSKIATL